LKIYVCSACSPASSLAWGWFLRRAVNFDEFTSARAESKKRRTNHKKAQFIQLVTFDCKHAHRNIQSNKIFIIFNGLEKYQLNFLINYFFKNIRVYYKENLLSAVIINLFSPSVKTYNFIFESNATLGELILHSGWVSWQNITLHQTIALKIAQSVREHSL
jgi:hypothetical protein